MKRTVSVVISLFLFLLIIVFFNNIISFVVNIKWYGEVGYLSVYFTKLVAILKLMVPIFILSYIGIWFYYKSIRKNILRLNKIVEMDSQKSKLEKRVFFLINFIVSFFISFGISSGYWYTILQFEKSVPFNITDPIFKKDISFYIFKLPLFESFYGAIFSILVFLVFFTLVIYFILTAKDKMINNLRAGNIGSLNEMGAGLRKFAGKQLAAISSLIMIMISLGYLIKSWNLVYSPRGVAFGASYTDIHVSLLFYKVIIIVSLIAAIVIFVSVLSSKAKPIFISVTVIIVLIFAEKATAFGVQNFIVKSNEKTLENPYIKYNIEYTRKAFNIDKVDSKPFEVKNDLTKEDVISNKDTINNIRINSFKPALEFYNQVQIIRYYYGFNDIDIDRYNINGKYNQVFIAPREINSQSLDPNTWQNKHLIYTHGYGVVMSKVNSVTTEGQPDFVIKDIPPINKTDVDLKNPRIYFGEKTNSYAIVKTKIDEFDYPQGDDNKTTVYAGKAGISMNFFNRLLFAINEKDLNFLLSRDLTSESKILYNRNIVQRAKKIAPFLTYDSDPYVVVSEGKLYWILDAYTTSNKYPFSQPQKNVNYIRNSVKVVIDAVDGSTNFYLVDKQDPIAVCYSKIFPSLFTNESKLPTDLKSHFRYPQDLFQIQCDVLGKYHVTDSSVFYNGEDQWQVASNQKKVEGDKEKSEAPYMVMKLPGEKNEEMILLEYFNMRSKDNMVALFGARMDKDNYGKLVIYKFPPQKTVYSPYLFKQKLNQDTIISKELSLWNKEGSQVQFGDTMIVPINNSLLYIEPVYLRASGKNSIPEMKKVVVSFGEKILLTDSVESGLQQIFDYKNAEKPTEKANSTTSPIKVEAIKKAKEFYDKAVEAQKAGDWTKYGENIKKLGEALNNN